jgi:hypothetical protein
MSSTSNRGQNSSRIKVILNINVSFLRNGREKLLLYYIIIIKYRTIPRAIHLAVIVSRKMLDSKSGPLGQRSGAYHKALAS